MSSKEFSNRIAGNITLPPDTTRSRRHYDEDDLTGPHFVDHFSLRDPSSTVTFRGARIHVYETPHEQILLEDRRSSIHSKSKEGSNDDDDNGKSRQRRHTITVKRMPHTSFGLKLLRLAYALISLLLFGYAFALSFQIILFLFVNLANNAGLTSSRGDLGNIEIFRQVVSTLLSIPVFLHGFSSLMAIATTFVVEAWSGGYLIRAVFGAPAVVSELLKFVFLLMIPIITFFGALFVESDNPWELCCYAWLGCVAFVFFCFALGVVWREVSACFHLLSINYGEGEDEDGGGLSSLALILRRVRQSILLMQMQKYSGTKQEQYLVTGEDEAPEGGYMFSNNHEPTRVKRSIYTRVAQLGCLRFMYEIVDPPKRTYSIEEVQDILPFVTHHSWSLEAMFFGSNKNGILSAKGPSALTREQILSSFVCNIFSTILVIVTVIGFLVWLSTGWKSYIFVGIISTICCLFPLIQSQRTVIQLYTDVNKEDLIDEEGKHTARKEKGIELPDGGAEVRRSSSGEIFSEETTLYRLWETSRVMKPKVWVCYTGMLLEFVFLFLFPVVTLFHTKNNKIGIVFCIVSFFSFLRYYFDASAVLCELGSMNNIDVEEESPKKRNKSTLEREERMLVSKARLAGIAGNISRSNSVTRWIWFFGTLVGISFFLFYGAIASDDGMTKDRPPIILVDDYAYASEKTLQYPTCSMSKGFRVSVNDDTQDTALGDYAFLSAMAYETTNITGYILPQWFGEGQAVDEDVVVKEYRKEADNSVVPVYFKLFSFPAVPNVAVLAIRGSQTTWDWMVNMQLWSASGLAQIVKWMLPFGWIWTPILDDLVWFISFIQSDQLDDIAYYKVTTEAVKNFKKSYDSIRVTGASLGGGLAIITGAQTKTPSIAISGLGVEFSRNAVKPPVTLDDINEYVFNFIPDRDYIARVGGRPRQHQEAHCHAETSNLFGCHSMWRSVCEINYRCGSNGRPVACRCHFTFGYPEPEPIGNTIRTFKEACDEQEQAFLEATGSTKPSAWS